MKDYQVTYKDEDGCRHEVEVTASDIPKAIDVCFELNKDCKQVIRAFMKPMFTD